LIAISQMLAALKSTWCSGDSNHLRALEKVPKS
jgi:hypothetical protein